MSKQPTFFQLLEHEFQKESKNFKRKKLKLKLKLFFTFVLPIVIILLFVKVIKVYVHLKLKSVKVPDLSPKKPVIPQHIEKQVTAPEFITPQPISAPVVSQVIAPADPHVTITELQEDV